MAELMLVNPRKRRTTKRRKTTAKRKAAPRRATRRAVAKVTRRRRRNPSPRTGIMNQVQNAAIGAAGAVATDVAFAKLPFIPANLKTGNMGALTKGAVAIGLGMLVSKVMKKKQLGVQIAEGGMTVALHNLAAGVVGDKLGIEMGGLSDESTLLGYEALGAYSDLNGAEFAGLSDDSTLLGFDEDVFGMQDELGYISPAQVDEGFTL